MKLAWLALALWPAAAADLRMIVSSAAGDRLAPRPPVAWTGQAAAGLPAITINPAEHFQKMEGFGATFTEAGLMVLHKLPAAKQREVLAALFDVSRGAGFSLMKSPLAAFDFASAGPWYSYDDHPGDLGLRRFGIRRDLDANGLVSFIRLARMFGQFRIQSTMDYPPDWMLDAKQDVKPYLFPALAAYQMRYLEEYFKQGIVIDWLSPFNEPQYVYCKISYDSVARYIKNHLGPALRDFGLVTRLQTSDAHTREIGLKHFPAMLRDPAVKRYVSTISLHGYQWDQQGSAAMEKLHQMFPDMAVWQSEVCYAKTIDKRPMPVYGFEDGDRWGRMILADVNHWASGWIYWNAILDQKGGPWLVSVEHGNPADNPQHPVVIVNTDKGEVHYPGLYWYLAHFSRYVRPGAQRVGSSGVVPDLSYAAFSDREGGRILEVVNSANEPRRFLIREGARAARVEQPARSIATYLW